MTKTPQSKADKIEQTKSNLPLPDQPPVASDWQSADASKVNVESGRTEGNIGTDAASSAGLREPATQSSGMDMSGIGRQAKDNLNQHPKDATR